MKKKLLIIGASGHGKVVADIAIKMNKWERIAFLDDNPNIKSTLGLDVLGTSHNIPDYIDEYELFVAIGNNQVRKKVLEMLESLNASIPTLIHPSAIIAEDVEIGKGTVLMPGTIINSSSRIGRGCIVNTAATVDHDNKIGDFVHISPGANLAGTVTVGECSWLGIGCSISNNVNITKESLIGAGAVVVQHINNKGVYIGVPARKIEK